MLSPGVLQGSIMLLTVEEDLTRRIFIGGIGLMLSGIVAVFVVFFLIKDNLDEVSCDMFLFVLFLTSTL